MQQSPLTGPDQSPPRQEHPAAAPERAAALVESIPEDAAQLARLRGRHLTSIAELDAPLVRQLLRLAARYEAGELADLHPMRSRILSNLFLDRTHCTGRLAFNAAWLRLGGNMLQLDSNVEQILKRRYAPGEIAELCNGFSDMAVLRTADTETFHNMLPHFRVPVISAGDGDNEHPTHALADLYLLAKWRPALLDEAPPADQRLGIGIVGDPSRTRTLRSFLRLLALFPQAVDHVVVLQRLSPGFSEGQREELEQAGLEVQTMDERFPLATDLEGARELVPKLNLIYMHYLQPVHVARMKIAESASFLRPDAMILDADVQNEEIANRYNDSPHNGYFAQVRGSVYLRMALFSAIVG